MTIDGCTFRENTALRDGGGLYTHYRNTLSIEDSTFRMNSALINGRCIHARLINVCSIHIV